jgi:hypothetical protein
MSALTAIDYRNPFELAVVFEEYHGYEPMVVKNVFKNTFLHNTTTIAVETIEGENEIAKFVSPGEDPTTVGLGGRTAEAYILPRIYERKIFTAEELAQFEVLDNSESSIKQANDSIQREIGRLQERLYRRCEQMACQALSTGKVTVSQDNVAFENDFKVPNSRIITRSSDATKWSAASGNVIVKDIIAFKRLIASSGAPADMLLVGTEVGDAIRSNEDLRKSLDTSYYDVGAVKLQEVMGAAGSYIGKIAGVNVFEYHQQYMSGASATDMIGTKKAIMVATGGQGFGMHYGGIAHIAKGALKIDRQPFSLTVNEDPYGKFVEWRLESYPLPVIQKPKALVTATVL